MGRPPSPNPIPKTIIKLTDASLSKEELFLLDLGPKFIPTVKSFPVNKVLIAQKRLMRSLLLKDKDLRTPKIQIMILTYQPSNIPLNTHLIYVRRQIAVRKLLTILNESQPDFYLSPNGTLIASSFIFRIKII